MMIPRTSLHVGSLALLMLSLTACDPEEMIATDVGPTADAGPDGGTPMPPTVLSTLPISGASDVARNGNVAVTFSEAMLASSLSATSFTVTTGTPASLVLGTVIYAEETAVFWPESHLTSDTTYTATVTTAATSAAGVALEANHVWTFTTGNTSVAGLPVDLRSAEPFVMLAKSGVSTVPTSIITGDIGLSPAAATFITGFSLLADATNVFSTSTQVTGSIYAADYAVPAPAMLTAAVSDMELAFTDASVRAPDVTELGAGNIGGMTLARGVYRWGTGLLIPTDVTLTGTATDVWIFQVAEDLTMSSGARIVLTGGALPENVFWQVAGRVELGTTAHCEGTLLSQTSITLRTGASLLGRAMAQTAIDVDGATLTAP
jgi:hypothetical protein